MRIFFIGLLIAAAEQAFGGVSVAPYVSIRSTESVSPNKKNKSEETKKITERREAGIKASLSFFRLISVAGSVGQSTVTSSFKAQEARDSYGEIDYQKEIDLDPADGDSDLKIKETQQKGKFSLQLDPGFWIFIARAKVGLTATLRTLETTLAEEDTKKETFGPTYKPHSGFGVGVRFGPKMYFMLESQFYHYKYPEIEPFERELTASYAVEL